MFVSAGWVSEPQAAHGQAGKISQKILLGRNTRSSSSQSPLCSCQSHTACPLESPCLFLPAFLLASLSAFLVASFPGIGRVGFL